MQHDLLAQVNNDKLGCVTDQVCLSQHFDGQAKLSARRFSAEPNQERILLGELSFYSANTRE